MAHPVQRRHKRERTRRIRKQRKLTLEGLEQRLLLVSDWTNPFNARDVNTDGHVSPLDALVGINELNGMSIIGSGNSLPDRSQHQERPLYDVNGDNHLTPVDILIVINGLNDGIVQPVINLGLIRDTGPNNTLNTDRVSFDPAVAGNIATNPSEVSRLTAQVDGGMRTEVALVPQDFSFEFDPAFVDDGSDDGSHTIRITAFDGDVIVNAVEFTFTYDSQPPALPIFDLTSDTDTGEVGDQLTNREFVNLVGQSEPGAQIGDADSDLMTLASTTGSFQLSGVSLRLGENTINLRARDLAGNESIAAETFTRLPADHAIVLNEDESFAISHSVQVDLGLTEGSRTLSFDVATNFLASDNSSISEDTFLVYLLDPNDPTQTLLDRGAPGTALFALVGDRAEFLPGTVRYDGSSVEIDVSSLPDVTAGLLHFQLLNLDSDIGSQVAVANVQSVLDLEGVASPSFSRTTSLAASGGPLDLTSLVAADDIEAELHNARFDSPSNRYRAELRLNNHGTAIGRTAALLFPDLPPGVNVLNPSGTDGNGDPYLNLTPAIPRGGLAAHATSRSILFELENPSQAQLPIAAQILVGGPNQAPVFAPIGALSVTPGETLTVPLSATDADGDTTTFSLRSDELLPSMTLAGSKLIIEPTLNQIGSYQFTLVARDGAAESTQQVSLDVVADSLTTTRISGQIQNTDEEALAGIVIQLGRFQTTTDADGKLLLVSDSYSSRPLTLTYKLAWRDRHKVDQVLQLVLA